MARMGFVGIPAIAGHSNSERVSVSPKIGAGGPGPPSAEVCWERLSSWVFWGIVGSVKQLKVESCPATPFGTQEPRPADPSGTQETCKCPADPSGTQKT